MVMASAVETGTVDFSTTILFPAPGVKKWSRDSSTCLTCGENDDCYTVSLPLPHSVG